MKSDPAAVAQMETIAKTSVLQPAIPEMGSFWEPMGNFGKAIANHEVTEANADAKTADFAKGLAGAVK